jgi:hypothetical protein
LTHPRPFPKGRENLLLKSALCSRTFKFDFRYFTSSSLSSIWEGLSFGSRYSNKPQIIHKCI